MKAILVCVNYSDYLEVTLPRNLHHFEHILVVTTSKDLATQTLCKQFQNVECFVTDLFYEQGAIFNKWKALEAGLDHLGREGWLCVMDADVIWPETLPSIDLKIGCLYAPHRRMMNEVVLPVPDENQWHKFPIHRNINEFAGYSQIFHATDPVLGTAPWHETNWKHAGGADSFFQRKWRKENKVRPPFEVLHLGHAGRNWCGRTTPYLDGTLCAEAGENTAQQHKLFQDRRRHRDKNYRHEKY